MSWTWMPPNREFWDSWNIIRKRLPFPDVQGIVSEGFASAGSDLLRDLNVSCLNVVCRYLDIPFNYKICSAEKYNFPSDIGAGQWALEICAHEGASEYVNPPGGYQLFDEHAFTKRGIKLSFLSTKALEYSCGPYQFIEGLSIVDVLMWNSPKSIRDFVYAPHIQSKQALVEGAR